MIVWRRFVDRADAGRQLAALLARYCDDDVLVLALPRGGVPVACEIARALHAPVDVLNVRKLGVPWNEELAMGAIAAGGVRVLNPDVVAGAGVGAADIEDATRMQSLELERRERLYRGGRPMPNLAGKTVILVDDGIATGASARAAVQVLRAQHPGHVVLAVPVVQATVAGELERSVDELVYVANPEDLYAIGAWYEHFPQLEDAEVLSLLSRAAGASAMAVVTR